MSAIACLLCTSPAVADCLCVACGAKLWAAKMILTLDAAAKLPPEEQLERAKALRQIAVPTSAVMFLARLETAKAARAAAEKAIAARDARCSTCAGSGWAESEGGAVMCHCQRKDATP